MSLTSPPMIGLDLEDFRRLGVRPDECRLTVIRRAAARSSRSLAERQLTSPSPQVGLQLSRIATSTYRLLDPRQRHDVAQRVHVGRILPNTLRWAGQTSFHRESETNSLDTIFAAAAVSDAELVEMLDLDMSPRSTVQETSWNVSLEDENPAEAIPRRGRREGARLRTSWVWLSLAGLTVGTLLGLATLHRGDESGLTDASQGVDRPSAISESAAERSAAQLLVVPERAIVAGEPAAASHPERATAESIDDGEPGLAVESTVAADVDSAELESDSPAESTGLAVMPTGTPRIDPSPSPRGGADDEMEQSENDSTEVVAADGFLPDPFSSRTQDAPPKEVQITTPEIGPIQERDTINERDTRQSIEPLPSENGERHSVPDDAEVRSARARLVALLPALDQSILPDDVEERISRVEALESSLPVGSADLWAARMMVAELAWLSEDFAEVRRRLIPLISNYDTSPFQPLVDSFIAACDSASLPETHQHLLENGFRLADQLLINELPRQCKQVIDALGRSELAEGKEVNAPAEVNDHASRRDFLEEFSQAANQTQRLGESARRIRGGEGEIRESADGVGILGRYHCLMLRQWEIGLPWLAEASDSRIASIAREELELGETGSEDEMIALAKRWAAVASRSRGRASDSMRLHSIEILEGVQASSRGLTQLEVERNIEEYSALLPPFLRPTFTPPSAPDLDRPAAAIDPKSVPEVTPSAVNAAAASRNGLSGRIKIDNEDIGVQLNYELGVAMTQSVLDTIADRLGRKLPRMTIEFDGEIDSSEAAKVIVSIAPSPQGLTQDVRIDDAPIEFDPQTMTAEVTLSEGNHSISWSIEAERIALATLRILDAESGQRINVVRPSVADDPTRPNALTVAMVRRSQ